MGRFAAEPIRSVCTRLGVSAASRISARVATVLARTYRRPDPTDRRAFAKQPGASARHVLRDLLVNQPAVAHHLQLQPGVLRALPGRPGFVDLVGKVWLVLVDVALPLVCPSIIFFASCCLPRGVGTIIRVAAPVVGVVV